ncbi:MAG: sterol desaturase family protein [Proteobacteria bacterium]|nr:sterol desaturase family protein [Pseudomonadota bacterium]
MQQLLHEWAGLLSTLPRKSLGLAAWLVALALVFGLLERWRPVRPAQRFPRRDLAADVIYYFLSGLLPAFAVAAATVAFAWLLGGLIPASLLNWVAGLPLWLRIVLLIVVGDTAYYWTHRWSHELPLLWKFHLIHHSPTELDWLVNTRAHPIDLALARVLPLLPLLAFGLRQPASRDMETAAAVYVALTTVWAFFVHANVRVRLGWLEQLIITPAFHHWHHHNERSAALGRNYASLLPWLDRLFGTYHLPKELPSAYGAADALPSTLGGQLLSPFRPRRGSPVTTGPD